MRPRWNRAASFVALAMVSAFVIVGFSAILSPVQAGKPGGLTATISPKSQTTYYGCVRCTPEGQFTFTASGGTGPYRYFVNYGDGSTQNWTGTGSYTYNHYYIALATKRTVTLTIIDANNLSASATATITISGTRHHP